MRKLTIIAFSFFTCLSIQAWAEMYKWIDANGTTVYSQSPPPQGSANVIAPPPPAAVSPDAAREKLSQQLQRLDDSAEDREMAQKKQAETKEKASLYATNCARARSNLTNLQGNPRRLIGTGDGNYTRLTEEDRQQLIAKTQSQIRKYCK